MKKILLWSLLIVFPFFLFGAQVSEIEARKAAKSFLTLKTGVAETEDLMLVEAKQSGNYIVYYRFELPKKGFILISGSSLTDPILGYSLEHNFAINSSVQYLLDRYEQEILTVEKSGRGADVAIAAYWESLITGEALDRPRTGEEGVGPLLTTLWNQDLYYNTYCPWDVYAGPYYDYRVPNGCVALAMAMIMNYYQYPTSGTGGVSYIPPGYPRQTVQFSQHSYHYPAMYDQPYFYDNEIAKLVYHCGVAVKMHYDYSGSGATEMEARTQFVNVFKYNSGTYITGPAMFDDWGIALKQQLDSRYPLFYTAANTEGGHAFVIDGYDENMLFHVNWGWGGSANGYFQITNLDPYGSGMSYNSGENTLFNLYPNTNFPAQCSGHQTLTASFGNITNKSANQLYAANSDCSWMIAVKDATDYVFEFSRLNTEKDQDLITIYNGPTTASGIAGIFSGDSIPSAIMVSGADSVLVTFTSNATVQGRGFAIRYRTVLDDRFCSGTVTKTSAQGNISDNSQDDDYKSETKCTWLIQPSYAGSFSCSFSQFDLKAGDFVDIYNNTTNPATFVNRFDIYNLPDGAKNYSFSKMKVVFVADNWMNGGGFTMNWAATIVGIEEFSGIKELQLYPNPASDYVNISFTTENEERVTCVITDYTGKVVFEQPLVSQENQVTEKINLPELAKGLYLLELRTASGKTVRKLMID